MIIKVVNSGGKEEYERYAFVEREVVVGRNPNCEVGVQIDSETISRKHMKVRNCKQRIEVMDMNSSIFVISR